MCGVLVTIKVYRSSCSDVLVDADDSCLTNNNGRNKIYSDGVSRMNPKISYNLYYLFFFIKVVVKAVFVVQSWTILIFAGHVFWW